MKVTTTASLAFLAVAPVFASSLTQLPVGYEPWAGERYYQFKYPIRRVAIIGAGVGGLIAYRELRDAGFDVHIYERDNVPGGNWHYSDEVPVDTSIPSNRNVAVGDYIPSLPPKGVTLPYVEEYEDGEEAEEGNDFRRRAHRAPKPIWKSLTSNAPAPVQQIRETPWPAGTPWALANEKLQRYLRSFASWQGVNANDNSPNISYNTRVELVEKNLSANGEEIGWALTIKELVPTKPNTLRATWRKENFDAIIVATGRYNAPNVPNIAGVKEWADRFPGHILHARQYRRPEVFANETVLIVGAATSGGEIARDIIQHVKKIYQSVRLLSLDSLEAFSSVACLKMLPSYLKSNGSFPVDSFAEGRIELINGTVISGVDRVIFATGYRYTYPFLPQYHNASLGLNDTGPAEGIQPIVTDGTHLRSLYLDAFYIPDPTLTFINANFGMQSFTYAEFVSLAIAKVWSRKADFPPIQELWRHYGEVYKERKGYGRHFQFLGTEGTRRLRFFQGWLNDAAVKYGGKQIDGLSKELPQISEIWVQARFNLASEALINTIDPSSLSALGIDDQDPALNATITGAEPWAQDLAFDDYW
ncbi:hypothetical protein M413DRAFT_421803 [Hebeloma cylindrosporum]|uniref:FAD/NAD(P)-binding domain-containing protein n=1 Tax=Hebeloma cylindrosporum TaxID=76867 RepID=A0A0C3C032_HEBCY|nr:hypothetical protein M413DRAFT_421803 [Hebeloma cylindrosporum h7]